MPMTAGDVMSRRVVRAKPDDTLPQVAKLMATNDISALPVCDDSGTPIGMISEGDLLHSFGKRHGLRRSWWLSVLADSDRLTQLLADHVRSDRRCARDLMTTPVVSVSRSTGIGAIAGLLLRHHIKRVPVVDNGKIVGIVSRADITYALAQHPEALNDERHTRRRGGDSPLG
jgi:CBS domain-containing protein